MAVTVAAPVLARLLRAGRIDTIAADYLRALDLATAGTARTSLALDQGLEALQVAACPDTCLFMVGRRTAAVARTVGTHFKEDPGMVFVQRREACRAGIERTAEGVPSNDLIRYLLHKLRIPFRRLAVDIGDPVQVGSIDLLHCLDTFHESRELLELSPLVVDGLARCFDIDRPVSSILVMIAVL